eukprot:TRINITY_DN88206_c0_g1_i1.p1 TRINITY_DN88206_c0_g1~~TRINITY_DN88206_c0_g1_i1.p1  ORF type:complete len:123 (-),score=27.06 TRINITY_DN88206_c0_g1_i1:128-496(-)
MTAQRHHLRAIALMATFLALPSPAFAGFEELIAENNRLLDEARAAGNQQQTAFYEARGQRIVDDENQANRARWERSERRLQEQREYGDRMRAESEQRTFLHYQKEMMKWQHNAKILHAHFGL